MRTDLPFDQHRASTGLVEVLDRVLDKGLLIAGDIRVSLAEVELLTIRIRLIVCSIDKAQQIGLDWWKHDAHLSRIVCPRRTKSCAARCGCSSAKSLRSRRARATGGATAVTMRTDKETERCQSNGQAAAQASST